MAGRRKGAKKADDKGAKAADEAGAAEAVESSPEKKAPEEEKAEEPAVTNGEVNGEKAAEREAAAAAADKKDEGGEKAAGDKAADDAEKKPKKPIKKTIPAWATMSPKKAAGGDPKKDVLVEASDMASVIVRALKTLSDEEGTALVSALALKKEVREIRPNWNKGLLKIAIAKALDKDRIKKVKGSFKLVKNPKPVKAKATKDGDKKKANKKAAPSDKFEDHLGNIFTWVCEPKEASILLIKKYIEAHHTKLDTGLRFKKAIENGLEKGQLDRINGTGMSGTVQLVDKAKKTGTTYEDAIEDAIIACNEPKDASIPALKHYLAEYHTEFNMASRPKVLLHALERCEAKGWLKRISGKGLSGSFRLAVPYRPSPRELWGEWYEEEEPKKPKKRKVVEESESESESESEEEESESESEEEEEVIPQKKQRGAPSKRGGKNVVYAKKSKPPPPPPAKKKKAAPPPAKAKKAAPPAKKKKAAASPAKKKAAAAKKSPAKKLKTPPAKKRGKR